MVALVLNQVCNQAVVLLNEHEVKAGESHVFMMRRISRIINQVLLKQGHEVGALEGVEKSHIDRVKFGTNEQHV